MRHAITVIGSKKQLSRGKPRISLRDGQSLHEVTWYACTNQTKPSKLLDDSKNRILTFLLAPLLAYRFYQLVHGTKLWSGKRPLIIVPGRGLSSRLAAYAGNWGGGDVVEADPSNSKPHGPTRFVLAADGRLKLREG